MKRFQRTLSLLLAMLTLFLTACGGGGVGGDTSAEVTTGGDTTGGDTTTGNPPVTDDVVVYNVIFALASIPPVLAALECIDSGYETYAIIERGKTYGGIEQLPYFHNVGFDPSSNHSNGFTAEEFDAMVEKVRELNEDASKSTFFNFYVQDGTALLGAAIAANAGVEEEQFHVYMCEDGTGAYHALYEKYVNGKTVDADTDQVYDSYAARAESVEAEFRAVMDKTDNKITDAALIYDIGKAFALASLDNFTYYLQDETAVVNVLESTGDVKTKLLTSFCVEGYEAEVEHILNLKYGKISDGIARLTAEEKSDYLTLMYGDLYADTYAALTRTERADEAAPQKKLVFIGARHNGYPAFASDATYGIGGLAPGTAIPTSYEALADKYKTPLLFGEEADYNAFLAIMNEESNYPAGISTATKNLIQSHCFNLYIDYMYTLKLTYALYGEDYDVIMKGHPREALGSHEQWGDRYLADAGNGNVVNFNKLVDETFLGFHASDSVGKKIGMVPYGTAAENLAYLGADIAIAGLPSSTYSGFDTDVDVLFILCLTDQDIVGTGADEAASQVKARYEAGNLLYTNENGEKQTTLFLNTGNLYKAAKAICEENGDTAMAQRYQGLYDAWLAANRPGAIDIDGQGFPVAE